MSPEKAQSILERKYFNDYQITCGLVFISLVVEFYSLMKLNTIEISDVKSEVTSLHSKGKLRIRYFNFVYVKVMTN